MTKHSKTAVAGLLFVDLAGTLLKAVDDRRGRLESGTAEAGHGFFGVFDAPATDHITMADR